VGVDACFREEHWWLFFDDSKASATFHGFSDHAGTADKYPEQTATLLIGTGAHGTVYASSTEDKHCIKAFRVGETVYIARELKALELLNVGKFKHIPELLCAGKLEYCIRLVTSGVPAILLAPLGQSVLALEETSRASNKTRKQIKYETARQLKKEIQTALQFAHKMNVYHLDVRLDNIVYHQTTSAFVLIDWANAACHQNKKNVEVVGFRGSLTFAHAEIHYNENAKAWKVEEKHDFVSLAFSIATFVHGRAVPWD
jgi:serine/threonine protein kinase